MTVVSALVSLIICVASVWALAELQIRWKENRNGGEIWLAFMFAPSAIINAVHMYGYMRATADAELWLTLLRCFFVVGLLGYVRHLGREGKAKQLKREGVPVRRVARG